MRLPFRDRISQLLADTRRDRVLVATRREVWAVSRGRLHRAASFAGDRIARHRDRLVVLAGGALWIAAPTPRRWMDAPRVGRADALVGCGAALWLVAGRELWRYGAGGWVHHLLPVDARDALCARGRLLLVRRGRPALPARPVPPGGCPRVGAPRPADAPAEREAGDRLRRARLARWLPRLTAVVRLKRDRDARTPRGAPGWPSVPDLGPLWGFDPLQRLRRADRFELMVYLSWPLGGADSQHLIRRWARATRARRRRSAPHSLASRLMVAATRPRDHRSSPTLEAVRRCLAFAERRALSAVRRLPSERTTR